jgi:hypothetical protein
LLRRFTHLICTNYSGLETATLLIQQSRQNEIYKTFGTVLPFTFEEFQNTAIPFDLTLFHLSVGEVPACFPYKTAVLNIIWSYEKLYVTAFCLVFYLDHCFLQKETHKNKSTLYLSYF